MTEVVISGNNKQKPIQTNIKTANEECYIISAS